MEETSPFDFQKSIFNILEKSCNLKLVAKRQEMMEEVETELKLKGFKVKERILRVINKIFEREMDLDDIFMDRGESNDEEEGRPT